MAPVGPGRNGGRGLRVYACTAIAISHTRLRQKHVSMYSLPSLRASGRCRQSCWLQLSTATLSRLRGGSTDKVVDIRSEVPENLHRREATQPDSLQPQRAKPVLPLMPSEARM